MKKISLLIFAALLLLAQSGSLPDMVIEMARHGARSVLSGEFDQSWPLSTWGNLTATGMRQHYLLGVALEQEYPNLLSAPMYSNNFYILSDVTQRCIQSALSQFYGIYLGQGPGLGTNYPAGLAVPPYNSPVINKTMRGMNDSFAMPGNHYPTIVPYVDLSNWLVFDSSDPAFCPNNEIWSAQNEYDQASLKAWQTFQPLIEQLNLYGNVSTPGELFNFGDTYYVDLYDNRTLPGGMPWDEALMMNLSFAFAWYASHLWDGQALQRETGVWGYGTSMLNFTEAFIHGDGSTNFVMFSGHDSNLVDLLSSMGIFNQECVMENFESYWNNGTIPYPNCHFPYFASTAKIELYNTSEPYIKFYYENNLIPICGNEEGCPYAEFKTYIEGLYMNRTLEQLMQVCGTTETTYKEMMNGKGRPLPGSRRKTGSHSHMHHSHPTANFEETETTTNQAQNGRYQPYIIFVLTLVCVILGVEIIGRSKRHEKQMGILREESMSII